MPTLTLSFKGKVLHVFPVREGETVIGSDPGSTIHIDSLAIQPHHARITSSGGKAVLYDLGTASEGTLVNNKRVEEQELKDGDIIRVGKHTLTYAAEAMAEAPAVEEVEVTAVPESDDIEDKPELPDTSDLKLEPIKKQTAWLQILSGNNLGKTIKISRKLTNLGTPGIQVALIAHRNDGYFLSHLEGKNPPKVDQVSIGDKSWPLKDGQVIEIGNIKMQFFLQ